MRASVSKSYRVGPEIAPEQFISEHLFFYLVKGTLSGDYGNKSYALKSGECGIARKNRLSRYFKQKNNEIVEKVIIVFDELFLKTFQEKQNTEPTKFKSAESFLPIANNPLIPGFMQSLQPYYNERGVIDKTFSNIKREELLLILLQSQPELSGVFFDYGIPGKIDLEAFMNRNFKFNVSMERFAYLTGRSLTSFKRDFEKIFTRAPGRWLMEKRLEEAKYLMEAKKIKPSDVYLEVGFEDLSHFSYAFKKMFNVSPTQLTKSPEN